MIVRVEIIRSTAIGVLHGYAIGKFTVESWEPLDIVRLCFLFIGVYEHWHAYYLISVAANGKEIPGQVQTLKAWNTLWDSMHPALQYYWDNQGWTFPNMTSRYSNDNAPQLSHDQLFKEDCSLALQCLQRIQAMQTPRKTDIIVLTPSFPTELSRTLELFTLPLSLNTGSQGERMN